MSLNIIKIIFFILMSEKEIDTSNKVTIKQVSTESGKNLLSVVM